MKKEKINKLKDDLSVIKLGETSLVHLLYPTDELVITFAFIYKGYPKLVSSDPFIRLMINAFPLKGVLVDIDFIEIKNDMLIMVNSDNDDYAMTFKISIDNKNKLVEVNMVDSPELGLEEITEDEKKRNQIKV